MIAAFTGTRKGMTDLQKMAVADMFDLLALTVQHNGAAEGADRNAHTIAQQRQATFHFWPSNMEQVRWADGAADLRYDLIHPMLPPLVRNRQMVNKATTLVATPRLMTEEQRSGTWATIRHARKLKRPTYIVWPDGSVTAENDILPKNRR